MKVLDEPVSGWKYQFSVERPSQFCCRSGRPASMHMPVVLLTMVKESSAAMSPRCQFSSYPGAVSVTMIEPAPAVPFWSSRLKPLLAEVTVSWLSEVSAGRTAAAVAGDAASPSRTQHAARAAASTLQGSAPRLTVEVAMTYVPFDEGFPRDSSRAGPDAGGSRPTSSMANSVGSARHKLRTAIAQTTAPGAPDSLDSASAQHRDF